MSRKATALLALLVCTLLFAGWANARGTAVTDQTATQSVGASAGAGPAFVQANKKYIIRWQPGDSEVYSVLELRGAWARARRDPGHAAQEGSPAVDVWLNLAQAITITEQR